ncbi:hypothetical protein GLP21_12240 [Photobacterium carnosum]|uniref:Uncharacterized protein n=1 Tax=Photobacterium carnosum TaxID=2023717 RepID=A0A2N4UW32_9GAMM|nr:MULTISPECIES: hypothetical protein [Photobacterium]MCD9475835.1 hypothetical protein [Photobacterium phosphoreum]MCD9485886.1 hypothetical protein [Photobacterium iliopiscarium]MCD9507697.1 hypothetical protein [Photobacterium phosphoreum]MCD9538182.1 hypothetical protein [Photobacterium carnosum]MCD9542986.1 hypothetical protein [Photobacterium carnosum]
MFGKYDKLIIGGILVITGGNASAQQLELPREPEYKTTLGVCSPKNIEDKTLCTFINNITTNPVETAALMNYANEVNSISGLKLLNVQNVLLYETDIQISADCYHKVYRGDDIKYGKIIDFVRRNALTTAIDKITYAKYTSILSPLTITYMEPTAKECAIRIKNSRKNYI